MGTNEGFLGFGVRRCPYDITCWPGIEGILAASGIGRNNLHGTPTKFIF